MENNTSNVVATEVQYVATSAEANSTEKANASITILKNFKISQSGVKAGRVCQFTDIDGKTITYNEKIVFDQLKDHFESLPCWSKYKYYTNSKRLPKFVRELTQLV